MRLTALALILAGTSPLHAQSTSEACFVIDKLDTLHVVQTRLSRNPDTVLFHTDIRILRSELGSISENGMLEAIQSNSLSFQGRAFTQFLQNTRYLLEGASLDDPNSIRPHFSNNVRSNLNTVRDYLVELRCPENMVAIGRQEALRPAATGGDGENDEDNAAEILRAVAEEVLNLTNLFVTIAIGIAVFLGTKFTRQFLRRQRRRAKRHDTAYEVNYKLSGGETAGALLDINCFGTKLRHGEDAPIEKGGPIEVKICDEWVNGTVIWTNTHYAGIQFKKAISLGTVITVCDTKSVSQKKNGAQKGAA